MTAKNVKLDPCEKYPLHSTSRVFYSLLTHTTEMISPSFTSLIVCLEVGVAPFSRWVEGVLVTMTTGGPSRVPLNRELVLKRRKESFHDIYLRHMSKKKVAVANTMLEPGVCAWGRGERMRVKGGRLVGRQWE